MSGLCAASSWPSACRFCFSTPSGWPGSSPSAASNASLRGHTYCATASGTCWSASASRRSTTRCGFCATCCWSLPACRFSCCSTDSPPGWAFGFWGCGGCLARRAANTRLADSASLFTPGAIWPGDRRIFATRRNLTGTCCRPLPPAVCWSGPRPGSGSIPTRWRRSKRSIRPSAWPLSGACRGSAGCRASRCCTGWRA